MGLLDDAIREHLELKKRHGAEPTEIADLEREAFGPARRGPEPLEVPGDDEAVAAVPEGEIEAGGDVSEVAEIVPPEVPVESEALPEPKPAPAAPEPGLVEQDLAWEDAATEPDEPVAETAPDAEADAEDVLEETPEFLQETPEHDRLWFEQRPPRDFDFDG
jgi:hypothetical protein